MRAYFSSYHLWAAKAFSASARVIETNHSGKPCFDVSHRAFVNSAILLAVAFAESAINELFQDAVDGHHNYIKNLNPSVITILANYWNMTEMRNKSHISILDKFQLALLFNGCESFNPGSQPYQDANLAIKLRNTIVHYKPESISSNSNHKLSKQLQGKFESNLLFKGSGNSFFPDHCLGIGCSDWVISSVKIFVDDFFKKMKLKPNYQIVDFGLPQLIQPYDPQ